jgi:hypothetical protein
MRPSEPVAAIARHLLAQPGLGLGGEHVGGEHVTGEGVTVASTASRVSSVTRSALM